MITLHLLQYLEDNGFGTINTDLFENLIPNDKTGVSVTSLGGNTNVGRRSCSVRIDFYCRGKNNLKGYDLLDRIRLHFTDNEICTLPTIANVSNIEYKKVRFTEIGNVETLPPDENNRNLYRLSIQINYEDTRGEK